MTGPEPLQPYVTGPEALGSPIMGCHGTKREQYSLPKHSQTMLNMGSLRQIAKKKGKVLNALVIFENALCHQNVEHRFTVDQKWPERT